MFIFHHLNVDVCSNIFPATADIFILLPAIFLAGGCRCNGTWASWATLLLLRWSLHVLHWNLFRVNTIVVTFVTISFAATSSSTPTAYTSINFSVSQIAWRLSVIVGWCESNWGRVKVGLGRWCLLLKLFWI